MTLWEKNSVKQLNKEIEEFNVGNDCTLDQKLAKFDAIASICHAKMLAKTGILTNAEASKLEKELKNIIKLSEKGKFEIKKEDEDCHTAIENFLVKKLGNLGKKIHTARSRNDQVLVALRLYSKKEILETEKETNSLIKALKNAVKKFGKIKMPGYTHMQKAMPSGIAMLFGAYIASLEDDLKFLKFTYSVMDQNPLGSAAGYGIPVKIDRDFTTKLLGFAKLQENPIYCANSRGKFESIVLSAMVQIMLDLNKMSSDLILFSAKEFGFIELPSEICTGSSIMPQKKNPDVLELIRAKKSLVEAKLFAVLGIISSLPSGYNRDFQLTKQPLIEGIEITKSSVKAMKIVISKLNVSKENCENALTEEVFATQNALELALKGIPWREAYKQVGKKFEK